MRQTDIKLLYNTYLRISRKKQNKPFKLRQNWDGFDESENYLLVLKLKNFFDRNEVVNIEDFFLAPYEVYPEESFYDLHYYNTISAVKVYNIYCNMKANSDPDSEIQINSVLKGLKFIKSFCLENKIKLGEYLNFKQVGATTNSFIVHLKEKNISIYNLFAFSDFERVYGRIDGHILKFVLNDLSSKITIFRGKFYGSKKCKQLSIKGLALIEKEINKNIS
jgi:hypothetical protein